MLALQLQRHRKLGCSGHMTEQTKREFFRLVVEKETTRCWSWIGAFGFDRRPVFRGEKAYRVMYKLRTADLPANFHVHHKCENSTCVNPRHLVALSPEAHRAVHATKDRALREQIYRGEWQRIKIDRSRGSQEFLTGCEWYLIATVAFLVLIVCFGVSQHHRSGQSKTDGTATPIASLPPVTEKPAKESTPAPSPIVTPPHVVVNRSKPFTPPISQTTPGKDVPPGRLKLWIEKNTPVALNLNAAKELRSMIQAFIERGSNIENGEDYRQILDAGGEAWARDIYVTKGKNLIQAVSNNENPVEESFRDEIRAFRVGNNPNIYFTDAHFVKHKPVSP
jgi:hypothetical protein